jgi:hypothetical protein
MALWIALVLLAAAAPGSVRAEAKSDKTVFGWVEEGLILPERTAVKMKLDTGALTSSMDARDIERFERNGQRWVRFNVEVKDIDTDEIVKNRFERAIIGLVAVRGAGGVDHRIVVTMSVCIGSQRYEGPFTLRNRKKMIYPILLGRKAIAQIGLVDVTRTFTVEPACR